MITYSSCVCVLQTLTSAAAVRTCARETLTVSTVQEVTAVNAQRDTICPPMEPASVRQQRYVYVTQYAQTTNTVSICLLTPHALKS